MLPVLVLNLAITVESRSPDALCPDVELTRRAVEARVGTIRAPSNAPETGDATKADALGSGWRAIYTIGHAPDSTEGDFIRVEVLDPDNVVRLQRDLPINAQSCLDMAYAIALVVDHFFRSLVAEPSPNRRPDPKDGKKRRHERLNDSGGDSSSPLPPPPLPPPPLESAASRKRRRRFMATAGMGVTSRPSSLGASLGISSELLPWLETGLGTLVLLQPERERVEAGSVEMTSIPLWVWVMASATWGRLDVAAGPEFLAAFDRAGSVDGQRTETRFFSAIGPRAQVRVWATERFGVTLTGGLDFRIQQGFGSFFVGSKEVFVPAKTQASLSVGFTWAPIR